MMAFLKRLLWPLRPRNSTEVRQFYARMDQAKAYGLEQQQASAQSRTQRATRDWSESYDVPPAWRHTPKKGSD